MLLKACKTFLYSVENKMRLVIYALYMAVEINLHSLFFWSFIQKIDKILTFRWSKTTESEGGNLIMKYMFFSSCSSWPQLLAPKYFNVFFPR